MNAKAEAAAAAIHPIKDKSFRDHFLRAITEARRSGEIQPSQFAVLWFMSLFPKHMKKIEDFVEHEAALHPRFGDSQKGIADWIALIKEFLPLILEIIEMFRTNAEAE